VFESPAAGLCVGGWLCMAPTALSAKCCSIINLSSWLDNPTERPSLLAPRARSGSAM
jgi:hypothetical protein